MTGGWNHRRAQDHFLFQKTYRLSAVRCPLSAAPLFLIGPAVSLTSAPAASVPAVPFWVRRSQLEDQADEGKVAHHVRFQFQIPIPDLQSPSAARYPLPRFDLLDRQSHCLLRLLLLSLLSLSGSAGASRRTRPMREKWLPLPKDSFFRAAGRRSRILCGQPVFGRPCGRASGRAGGGSRPLPRRRHSVEWLRAGAAHEQSATSVMDLDCKTLFCKTSPPPHLTRRSTSPSPFSHAQPMLTRHIELLRNCRGYA